MKILFDQGVPVPLRAYFTGHEVRTSHELGWSALKNGELLDAAEGEQFTLMITTDQQLKYQQNLEERALAILVLLTTSWPKIEAQVDTVISAVELIAPGQYVEVTP